MPIEPWTCLEDRQLLAEWGLHVGHLNLDGQRLRVALRPAEVQSAAPPLLIFNGIGANLELAGPLMAALPGSTCLIFDVPGAGQSRAPELPYRLSHLARLSERVLDRLGFEVVDVLGVSWGGGLAQQFTLQAPGRVRRLVLAATSMGALMVPAGPRTLLRMLNPRRYHDMLYLDGIAPELYGGRMRNDPEALRLFTRHARGGSARGYRYQLLAIAGWTSLPGLCRLRQPTLVLAGSDDPLVPLINARLLAWLLPDARLHVLDDGHLFMLTQPTETAALVSEFTA